MSKDQWREAIFHSYCMTMTTFIFTRILQYKYNYTNTSQFMKVLGRWGSERVNRTSYVVDLDPWTAGNSFHYKTSSWTSFSTTMPEAESKLNISSLTVVAPRVTTCGNRRFCGSLTFESDTPSRSL